MCCWKAADDRLDNSADANLQCKQEAKLRASQVWKLLEFFFLMGKYARGLHTKGADKPNKQHSVSSAKTYHNISGYIATYQMSNIWATSDIAWHSNLSKHNKRYRSIISRHLKIYQSAFKAYQNIPGCIYEDTRAIINTYQTYQNVSKHAKTQTPFVQAPKMWNLHILNRRQSEKAARIRRGYFKQLHSEMADKFRQSMFLVKSLKLRVHVLPSIFVLEKITVLWARSCAWYDLAALCSLLNLFHHTCASLQYPSFSD